MAKSVGRVLLVMFITDLIIGVWVGVLFVSAITAGTKHWVLGNMGIWLCLLIPVQLGLLLTGKTLIAQYREHCPAIGTYGNACLLVGKVILGFSAIVAPLSRIF